MGTIMIVFQHQMLDTYCLNDNGRHNMERSVTKCSEREMPMWMTKSINTMVENEKLIYIDTCFNGVAIEEWINIIKLW